MKIVYLILSMAAPFSMLFGQEPLESFLYVNQDYQDSQRWPNNDTYFSILSKEQYQCHCCKQDCWKLRVQRELRAGEYEQATVHHAIKQGREGNIYCMIVPRLACLVFKPTFERITSSEK